MFIYTFNVLAVTKLNLFYVTFNSIKQEHRAFVWYVSSVYRIYEPPGGLVGSTRDSCARGPLLNSRQKLRTACTQRCEAELSSHLR